MWSTTVDLPLLAFLIAMGLLAYGLFVARERRLRYEAAEEAQRRRMAYIEPVIQSTENHVPDEEYTAPVRKRRAETIAPSVCLYCGYGQQYTSAITGKHMCDRCGAPWKFTVER